MGYCNWKDATSAFKKHQESKTHCEAVEAMITLPNTTSDVGELLSKAHKEEKELARDMLRSILSSVRYLARQGLALRGDDDAESNLIQLLQLRAEDNPQLVLWLQRSSRKYHLMKTRTRCWRLWHIMSLGRSLGACSNHLSLPSC